MQKNVSNVTCKSPFTKQQMNQQNSLENVKILGQEHSSQIWEGSVAICNKILTSNNIISEKLMSVQR